MTWLRSEEEVDEIVARMLAKNNGRYITQGVSFSKTCPRQMDLLKKALMSSASFSGLVKELLAIHFSQKEQINQTHTTFPFQEKIQETKSKDIGNFLKF